MEEINVHNIKNWYKLYDLYFQLKRIIDYTEEFSFKAKNENVSELADLFTSDRFKEAIFKVKKYNSCVLLKTARARLDDYRKSSGERNTEQEHLVNTDKNNVFYLGYEFATLMACDDDGWYKVNIYELVVPNIAEIQDELNIIDVELNRARDRINDLFSKGLIRRLR